MGVDSDLAGILREVVQFLESLWDIDLPTKIENAKVNLLQRSRTKLSTFTSNRGSTSPEPYLDMNAGKGLLLFPKRKEIEIEEYVGVEEQPASLPPSHQDYYESFQEIGRTINDKNNKTTGTTGATTTSGKLGREEGAEDKLLEIYKTFTPAMTMNKAHKFGPLGHKIERKSFRFVRGNIRPCWIGLVGSHLLIYSSEKDKQPPEISSIRGYMGRPASNAIFKDQEHAKSSFEIFCPGNKTLQFIAKTPREMEEWLAAISRTSLNIQDRDSGMYERSVDEKIETELPNDTAPPEERYQDVGGLLPSSKREELVVLRTTSPVLDTGDGNKVTRSDSDKKKVSIAVPSISPPALPVRLPRRLPSLPNEDAPMPSYEPMDDGNEEDDIYHKIEDFRENGRSYENVKKQAGKRGKVKKVGKKKEEKKKKKMEESPVIETYNDVNNHVESTCESKKKQRISLLRELIPREVATMETYDDVQAIAQNIQTSVDCNSRSPRRDLRKSFEASNEKNIRSSFTTYDDVIQPSSIISTESHTKTDTCDSTESKDAATTSPAKSPKKSPQKKSFLDRVRHRKDSPKKENKKKVEDTTTSGKKLEKKEKMKVSLEPTLQTPGKTVEPDLPTYDDVSEYQNNLSLQNASHGDTTVLSRVDDHSDYNCPPPPRPVYIKPPTPVVTESVKHDREIFEDVYDDIANYRDNNIEIEISTEIKKTTINLIIAGGGTENMELQAAGKPKINTICNNGVAGVGVKSSAARASAIIDEENHDKENKFSIDTEHYQIPRTDALHVNPCTVAASEQEEQLYDDIAILAEFRTRERDSGSSSSHDIRSFSSIPAVDKLTISMKKPWSRFGSGKKVTTRDISSAQTTTMKNKSCTDHDEVNEPSIEKTDLVKPNKLQKLINKMESTLGKQPSVKSVTPLSNKTHNSE